MGKSIQSELFKDLMSSLFPTISILDWGEDIISDVKNYRININDIKNEDFKPKEFVLKIDFSKRNEVN